MKEVAQWKKDYAFIKTRMEECGIGSVVKKNVNVMAANAQALRRNNNFSYEYIDFLVLRDCIRRIITNDLIWLAKWCTDKASQMFIEEVHRIAWDFFNKGISAIPKKYQMAGKFNYKPFRRELYNGEGKIEMVDVTPKLLLIPRGLAKTVTFHSYNIVRHILWKPKGKWLITHGDKNKVKQNLGQIKQIVLNPALACVAPDLFCYDHKEVITRKGKVTTEKIDLVRITDLDSSIEDEFNNYDIRREATINIASMNTNPTGLHFDGQFDDDLVTEDTSCSPEATQKALNFYRNSFPLAEHPGRYIRWITGTRWYENCAYEHLMKSGEINYFCMPGMWEGIWRKKKTKFLLSKRYDAPTLERMKIDYGEWFSAHVLMIPRPFDDIATFVKDVPYKFTYRDEANKGYDRIDFDLEHLKENGCVVTIFDPSYSTIGKTWANKDSKASIITGVIYRNKLWVIDEWQALGGSLQSLYEAFRNQIMTHEADYCIVDSSSNQIVVANEWERLLKQDYKIKGFMKYKQTGNKTQKGKAQRAVAVLSETFKLGTYKVHHSCKSLCNELERITGGYDFLDCLIMVKNTLDFELYSNLYENKRQYRRLNRRAPVYKPIFKTAGY